MPMRVLILSETGRGPVLFKILSLTGPSQGFYQFLEDWNNVLPKLLPNQCFCNLVVASIFYFRQITL